MNLSMIVNTLQNISRRLFSVEEENVRLQGEVAILQNLAATKIALSQVQLDLASL